MQLSVELTFGKAVRHLKRLTGVVTSRSTARRRTYAVGTAALAVEATELAGMAADPPPVQARPICLQVSIDATKVQVVGGQWTDVKLGSLAQVVEEHDQAGQPVAKAIDLSYAARWEPAEQFGQTLTLETQRRGLDGAARVVSPNEGALWIQDILSLLAPQAVRILDEPHGAEHLGLIAQLAFGPTSLLTADWVARQRTALLEDLAGPTTVLAELDRLLARGPHPHAPRTAEDPDPAKALAREVAYFHTRADQIRYVHFRQLGYPIGSGCVESGHGVVIAPRFKGAGRRWAPGHLNPLLVLRTIEANERWEATWPTVWQALHTTSTQDRQTRQHQRRTLRLVQARKADDDATPAVLASPPASEDAVLTPSPPPAPPPVRAKRSTPRRRRPAPNHPWRHSFLPPKQQRAS